MSFAEIPETSGTEFKSTHYVKIESGTPLRLRILDKKSLHVVKHFIPSQKLSIMCLDEETCPICQNNSKLMRTNPELNPRQIRGFIPRQNRYMTNVLNRTLVKKSPSGNVIFAKGGQFPSHDTNTGELLVDIEAQPLNRVEVLERGPTLFSQLNAIMTQVTDDVGNSVPLDSYDIVIMANGQGRKMTTNVIPYPNANDVVEVNPDDLNNLESLGITLSADEILKVLGGTSLRDIFEARRSEEEVDILSESEAKAGDEVQASIESLFSQ